MNLGDGRVSGQRQGPLLLAVRPTFSYNLIACENGQGARSRPARLRTWITAASYLQPQVFDYMRPGEELVVEPFQRLIDAGELVAYRHDGFWASMDTLKDKQLLEDMLEKGRTPWLPWTKEPARA